MDDKKTDESVDTSFIPKSFDDAYSSTAPIPEPTVPTESNLPPAPQSPAPPAAETPPQQFAQTPTTPPTTPIPPSPSVKNANRMWKIIAIIGLLVFIGGISVILASVLIKPAAPPLPSPTPMPTIIPRPTASPSPNPSPITFMKRHFDPQANFFENQPFPEALRNFTDDQLKNMKCSKNYFADEEGVLYLQDTTDSQVVSDIRLAAFVRRKNDELVKLTPPKNVSVISGCDLESQEYVLHYEIHANAGGTDNTAYFELYNGTTQIDKTVSIPNNNTLYFTCQHPYAVTTTNQVYYGCSGGDGGAGHASIYTLDFLAGTANKVTACNSISNSSAENPVGTATVTCTP